MHITCVLMHPWLQFHYTGSIAIHDKGKYQNQIENLQIDATEECYLCENDGGFKPTCDEKTCNKKIHVSCALNKDLIVEKPPKKFKVFCEEHELENRKKNAKYDKYIKNKKINIPIRKSATVTPQKQVTPLRTKSARAYKKKSGAQKARKGPTETSITLQS